MQEPRLYLRSGEEVLKSETSRHHLFGYEFDVGIHRKLRVLGGCVIRMANEYHLPQYETSLHANVEAPKPPHFNLARHMYDFMNSMPRQVGKVEAVELLAGELDLLARVAMTDYIHYEAEHLSDNLYAQLDYIREGAVYGK